ncbi:hypothetical protein Fmac_009521 [Flemingia macrophylla]|uniref:Uncharacterized protein n=1 Tax=Flemingia macrophylla TaxID=520843 RepID=A0ABD1N124_9FABA
MLVIDAVMDELMSLCDHLLPAEGGNMESKNSCYVRVATEEVQWNSWKNFWRISWISISNKRP